MTADPASVTAGIRLLSALTVPSAVTAGHVERGDHDGLRRPAAGAVERSST
jgi:hypothetical protein